MSSNTSQCSADRRKALLAELSRGEVEAILSRKGLPSFTRKTLNSLDALVSDLEAARAQGWSLDDEERTLGMRCLATAIFNEHREAVARVSPFGVDVCSGVRTGGKLDAAKLIAFVAAALDV